MKTSDISKYEALKFSVMRIVEANPNVTQRELNQELGISLGRVNYCLNALTEIGFIKVENFKASSTKWRYAYILTPSGIAEKAALTGKFLARKLREYDALKAEIGAIQKEAQTVVEPHT
ncbi:MarR family EPS-associated transcriptional regulator [Sneathiella sp.]|uniref:MarR family EPS-associated transcriptional regulator n=1 Tax=Sneathiella sp. TaxID=1964365 RepID=UPI003569E271